MYTVFIILGLLIITALSAYAIYLLLQVKQQKQHAIQAKKAQEITAKERLDKLLDDIRYIAQAMLEDRCEVSEGVIRIAKLFDILGLTEQVTPDYPSLFKHYNVIKEHPIKEQRKSLPKQQRMQLDYLRMRSESKLTVAILDEAKRLTEYQG